ncbi:MAG: dephospho-CoA kinase [Planctomycetota bacterium]|nr:dephospho-CoA kinase [Planctomycetota bacterium]
MDKLSKKPIIGILGGIGSGKSTVTGEFVKLGCKAIDADRIVREFFEQEPIKKQIAASFGDGILDSAGKIDRKKLADIVFSDGNKLSLLNSIIHPLVLARAEELIARYKDEPAVKAIVLDMPLLVEVGWEKLCDKLVFVDCNPKIRAERAKKAGVFSKNQLKIRENFQISLDKKKNITDNTIDNNSDFLALVRQVANVFTEIMSN